MQRSTENPLPTELLAQVAAQGKLQLFSAGALLVREGTPGDCLFILTSGSLKVFTSGPNDREFVFNVLGPGELLGEMVLDGGPRTASVQALTDSECVVIERCNLASFLEVHPRVAEHLLLTLIGRLRRASLQIHQLVLNDVYERTVLVLRAEALVERNRRYLPAWLTQKEIAARVGATREMVGKILRDLQRGGFLVRDDRRRMLIKKEFPKRW